MFPWQPRTRNTAVAISSLQPVLAAREDGTALLPAVPHGVWHGPLVSWLSRLGPGVVTHIHTPTLALLSACWDCREEEGTDKLPVWTSCAGWLRGGSTCKDCLGDGHLGGWSFTVFEVGKWVVSEAPWRQGLGWDSIPSLFLLSHSNLDEREELLIPLKRDKAHPTPSLPPTRQRVKDVIQGFWSRRRLQDSVFKPKSTDKKRHRLFLAETKTSLHPSAHPGFLLHSSSYLPLCSLALFSCVVGEEHMEHMHCCLCFTLFIHHLYPGIRSHKYSKVYSVSPGHWLPALRLPHDSERCEAGDPVCLFSSWAWE